MVNQDEFQPNEALRHNIAQLMSVHPVIQGSIAELSKLTGISRQGLSKLLKGSAGNPGLDTLVALSTAFGVSVSQLIGQSPLEAKFTDQGIKKVPILLWQQAIKADTLSETKTAGNWDDWVLTTISLSPQAFALRVESKHLEPFFHAGDLIVIDPAVEAADDDYVIVQTQTCEKARIKKIVNDGNLWLHSLVAGHEPVELKQNQKKYKICGVILQAITMYREE